VLFVLSAFFYQSPGSHTAVLGIHKGSTVSKQVVVSLSLFVCVCQYTASMDNGSTVSNHFTFAASSPLHGPSLETEPWPSTGVWVSKTDNIRARDTTFAITHLMGLGWEGLEK
jgi:hypothetical protein